MKTERQSPSGSDEGSSLSDDGDFVDVDSVSGDDRQYEEYDVNTFLDSVLTGVGTDDLEIKRLGNLLRKACADGNLIQLVRGVLHLVELYQAGKRSRERSRSKSSAVGRTRTAPSKSLKRGTRSSIQSLGKRRRHDNVGVVPQRGNLPVDLIEIEEEEENKSGTSGQEDENDLNDEDRESSTVKPENEITQDEEERLPSEVDEEKEDSINNDWDSPTVTPAESQGNANSLGEEEETAANLSSSSRLPRPKGMPQDPLRISPSREKATALKRKRGLRKPPQRKKKISENVSNTGGESSSSRRDVSILEDASLSGNSSRNDQGEAAMTVAGPLARRLRNNSQKKKTNPSKDVPNTEEEDSSSSSSESDDSLQENDFLSALSDESSGCDDEEARPLKRKRSLRKPPQKEKKASEDIPLPTNNDASHSRHDQKSSTNTQKGKRTHKCPVCKKMWPSKTNLEIHLRVHTGERPFLCPRPNCGKKFIQNGDLARHLLAHGGAKTFKCPYPGCRKTFAWWLGLEGHKRVHTGVMPFKCKFPGCSKEFAMKSWLRNHEGIHSRPFKCPFQGCGQAFTQKGNLKRHQKTRRHI